MIYLPQLTCIISYVSIFGGTKENQDKELTKNDRKRVCKTLSNQGLIFIQFFEGGVLCVKN